MPDRTDACAVPAGTAPLAYRPKPMTVEAVRWVGEANCDGVFEFLGWTHSEDELDHGQIHLPAEGAIGQETAYPGDWILRTADGGFRVATDRHFTGTFEPAGFEDFEWGRSVQADVDHAVLIHLDRDGEYAGAVVVGLADAAILADMLRELVDEIAGEGCVVNGPGRIPSRSEVEVDD